MKNEWAADLGASAKQTIVPETNVDGYTVICQPPFRWSGVQDQGMAKPARVITVAARTGTDYAH